MAAKDTPTATPVDPQFYESVITKNSWWQTKDRERTFVVVSIRYDQIGDSTRFEPVTVVILELLNETPVERPWSQMVAIYKHGDLVKVSKPS